MLSAGILAYRKGARGLEVLLVHPGGPFWRKKDNGAWSIPKGEIDAADAPEQVARREFAEELGPSASIGPLQALGEVRQRGGKRVIAFAGEGHFDPAALASNTFDIEWPPRSGRRQNFPEVDRAEWFDIEFARTKMLSGQVELLDRLLAIAGESAEQMTFRIGIISDTHGLLRPEAERRLDGRRSHHPCRRHRAPRDRRFASPDRARHGHPWKRGQWRVGARIPRHETACAWRESRSTFCTT